MSNRIMSGRGQSPNIAVDVTGQAGITREIAIRGARRAIFADRASGAKIERIIVIGPDFEFTMLPDGTII